MYLLNLALIPPVIEPRKPGHFSGSILIIASEMDKQLCQQQELSLTSGYFDMNNSWVFNNLPFEYIADKFIKMFKDDPINTMAEIEVHIYKKDKTLLMIKRLSRKEMLEFVDKPVSLFRPVVEDLKCYGLWKD